MPCVYDIPPTEGKHVAAGDYYIPSKVGQPLSAACQRATYIGSIPSVFRWASFTKVDGEVVTGVVADGGIENPESFFKTRSGCYQSDYGRPSGGTTCG